MRRTYRYVGPASLAKLAAADSQRVHVTSTRAAIAYLANHPDTEDRSLTVTFVVLPDGLWIADRHSEHIAAARGQAVLSAGEMTLAVDGESVSAVYVTNQSTGYCPEPESWVAVAEVLDSAGIDHDDAFSAEMTFRRCPSCGATNIVKDGWFRCPICDAELPQAWNF